MDDMKVVRASNVAPDSDEGHALFASLFGESIAPERVQTFAHSTPPGHPTERHVHTADVAAFVTRGRMEIATAPEYEEPLVVEAGDYLFIPEGLAHLEQVIGDQEVEFVVAHLRGFHTLSASE